MSERDELVLTLQMIAAKRTQQEIWPKVETTMTQLQAWFADMWRTMQPVIQQTYDALVAAGFITPGTETENARRRRIWRKKREHRKRVTRHE